MGKNKCVPTCILTSRLITAMTNSKDPKQLHGKGGNRIRRGVSR